MQPLSVVIISKNSIRTIGQVIRSAQQSTNDILLIDSGSTDGTTQEAKSLGARLIEISWNGFGAARNKGAENTEHEFVLYLDSDELLTPDAVATLKTTKLDANTVYGFRRRNFVGSVEIQHGGWGNDIVYRLHHKSNGAWNLDEVHEKIVVKTQKKTVLKGEILHYTTSSIHDYAKKLDRYAQLSAENYFKKNKKVSFLKPGIAATFNFFKNYIFLGGILDGKLGWELARLHAKYTFWKYGILRRMYLRH